MKPLRIRLRHITLQRCGPNVPQIVSCALRFGTRSQCQSNLMDKHRNHAQDTCGVASTRLDSQTSLMLALLLKTYCYPLPYRNTLGPY